MAKIEIRNLLKYYADSNKPYSKLFVLDKINLNVGDGEFIAIVGPNGCGKTTLLKIIAGIEPYDKGEVLVNKKNPLNTKKILIFQNYHDSLFPWLSCLDNILFPFKLKGNKEKFEKAKERLKNLLKELKINLSLEKYPYELSGGQQQLVAILRAVIYQPDFILMDEPFSSLSYEIRLFMEQTLLQIREYKKPTILFVSHDIEEAIFLANKVIVLSDLPAKIIQIIDIPFRYPRKKDLLVTKEFFEIKKKCLQIMKDGVKEA